MFYVQAARSSPAIYFIEAKRKKRCVVALDCGTHWIFHVGKIQEGYVRTENNELIDITPNSLKYSRGVLFGVGEDFRGKIVSPNIIETIKLAVENKIRPHELKNIIKKIEGENVEEKQEISV